MKCKFCSSACIRKGRQKSGVQRYRCSGCGKYQQNRYAYRAYHIGTDREITSHLKEGCGIRSIGRLLGIADNTVMRRILVIAAQVSRPAFLVKGEAYEMDEMKTYIGSKNKKYWVAYTICKETRQPIDFRIGKRTNKTLRPLAETLLLSDAKTVCTDGLSNYTGLIPEAIHEKRKHHINRIERKNLNLRTHLKRLQRRTICYSRSLMMLAACLKIFFWG